MVHYAQIRPDIGGQIGLVDDEHVGPGDAGAALAWDFLACGYIDDIDRDVRQFWAEGRRQIVAAGFNEDQIELGEQRCAGIRRFPPP